MVFHSDYGCLEGGGGEYPCHLTYIFDPAINKVNDSENIEYQNRPTTEFEIVFISFLIAISCVKLNLLQCRLTTICQDYERAKVNKRDLKVDEE